MPLKKLKTDTSEQLTLAWSLHVKDYHLTVDKKKCTGCQICTLACPKEAIELKKRPKKDEKKAERAKIDINLDKCNFCGICDVLCPYGAITVTVNGQHPLSIIEKESFPRLIRDIQVEESAYPGGYMEEEEICPLGLIQVTYKTPDGKKVERRDRLTEEEQGDLQVKIDIQKEYCPCCRVCEFKFPEGVITVRKIFQGKINIHPERCPEGCTDCLDVCPITGALYRDEGDEKIHLNEMFCVYCGACQVVCPEEEALEVKRTGIRHTPVNSGAWNKALEKVASPVAISKELTGKGGQRARKIIADRLGGEV